VDRCDVLVVGGGPGGSACARSLVRAGLDVLVLDRKPFPRDKVCAGWITPQVCAELELDPADYCKSRVMQPIRGFAVELEGGRQAVVDCGEVVSYGIRRCEFDHYLLGRSGARTRLGEPLRELRREGPLWRANGDVEARFLVGAGGHFCPVARFLGARPGETEPTTVVAREIEFALDPEQEQGCRTHPELPELIFTRDLRGYGWVVRKGGWLNVGLGRQDTEAFPRRVDGFLDRLAAGGRVPPGLPRGLRGHAYLLYDEAPRPLARPGALLVGDAAGLASGRSGEGIRPAVESGLLAAAALREACAGRERDPEASYARAVTARFGRRHGRRRPGLTDRLPAAWRPALAERFLANPHFARRVVVERWFLHRETPPLGVV
jgi:flavin-dependent dehydrogenase